MKKRLSALMCIILVLSMLLALTGCSGGDKAKLVGKWKCEKDVAEVINRGIAIGDENIAEYVSIDEFKIVVYMEFNENDTFSMYADPASLDAAMDDMKEDLIEGLSKYMEDMIFEQTGLSLPVEEILELAGMTMDDLLAEIVTDDLVDEMVSEIASEGKFKAEDGKLHTSAGLQYEVDPAVYETYTLEGDKLTLLEYVGDDADANDALVYPMVFVKIG